MTNLVACFLHGRFHPQRISSCPEIRYTYQYNIAKLVQFCVNLTSLAVWPEKKKKEKRNYILGWWRKVSPEANVSTAICLRDLLEKGCTVIFTQLKNGVHLCMYVKVLFYKVSLIKQLIKLASAWTQTINYIVYQVSICIIHSVSLYMLGNLSMQFGFDSKSSR